MHTPSTFARSARWLLLAVTAGVYLSPLEAQVRLDDIATAIELQGQVSVLSGERLVALFPKSMDAGKCTVRASQMIVTGADGHAVFQIADGSTFEVFPNSHVAFRATNNFEDMVELILGKIRVMIEHRRGPNPKKVSTPTAIISVRGTTFDVEVEDDDGTTLVSVEEGEVDVRNTKQGGTWVSVEAGRALRIYPNQPLAKARSTSPGFQIVFNRLAGIAEDVLLHAPGGGGGLPGGPGGLPGGQGDNGKHKKNPPVTTPPPPAGGGL